MKMRRIRPTRRIVSIVSVVACIGMTLCLLTACGQKGPLYLPTAPNKPAPGKTPAVATTIVPVPAPNNSNR